MVVIESLEVGTMETFADQILLALSASVEVRVSIEPLAAMKISSSTKTHRLPLAIW
jgi:hypothetical protein